MADIFLALLVGISPGPGHFSHDLHFSFPDGSLDSVSSPLILAWDPCVILHPAYAAASGSTQHVGCVHEFPTTDLLLRKRWFTCFLSPAISRFSFPIITQIP